MAWYRGIDSQGLMPVHSLSIYKKGNQLAVMSELTFNLFNPMHFSDILPGYIFRFAVKVFLLVQAAKPLITQHHPQKNLHKNTMTIKLSQSSFSGDVKLCCVLIIFAKVQAI